jgi:hypothetical protein
LGISNAEALRVNSLKLIPGDASSLGWNEFQRQYKGEGHISGGLEAAWEQEHKSGANEENSPKATRKRSRGDERASKNGDGEGASNGGKKKKQRQ